MRVPSYLFAFLYIVLVGCISSEKKKINNKSESHTQASKKMDPKLVESIQRGSEIYSDLCVTCHLPNGKGVPNLFPPLAQSDYLMNNRIESIKAIKYGLNGEIVVNGKSYNSAMVAQGLSDTEVADVMNYISNSWGNENRSMVSEKEVSEIKP
ncbi:cytochrome c [Psychroserpens sp. XS_ASV72]|uniref:c-type cytochrome n=1 Tax=Psychroserpens sp. XS_ASV72 TaxID=3241293 RepID=UPI003517BBCB